MGTGKPVYALGDVNFDLLRPTEPDVRKYVQALDDLGLHQLVRTATRSESGTLIDHLIVKNATDVKSVTVVPCSWSDHYLVLAETCIRRERRRRPCVTIMSTRSLVPDALCLDLLVLLADWTAIADVEGSQSKWRAWLEV